jgi:hypothetical protein
MASANVKILHVFLDTRLTEGARPPVILESLSKTTKYEVENVNWRQESGASSRRCRSSYGGKCDLS